MSDTPTTSQSTNALKSAKSDMARLSMWSLITLVACVWPFVSVMPLFSLIEAPGFAWKSAVQVAFAASGFWTFALLLGLFEWARIKPQPDPFPAVRRRLLPKIAAFGALWIAAYAAAKYMGWA